MPEATHVPLLNLLKVSAQVSPLEAKRLATTLRTHSITHCSGCTYFHRAGFLLPMVVSSVTWRRAEGWRPAQPQDSHLGHAATKWQCCVSHSSEVKQNLQFWSSGSSSLVPWMSTDEASRPRIQLCPGEPPTTSVTSFPERQQPFSGLADYQSPGTHSPPGREITRLLVSLPAAR